MLGAKSLYGIIGDPVLHSASPVVHNTAFQHLGISAVFMAWQINPKLLPMAIQAVRALKISGLAVTLPHKEKVIPFLDKLSIAAQRLGAVNTLYWEDDALVGHNCDIIGFMQPLRKRPCPQNALILGAGGAARAALGGLLALPGIEIITVCARREEQAKALISSLNQNRPTAQGQPDPIWTEFDSPDIECPNPNWADLKPMPKQPQIKTATWEQRNDIQADLIVNATPLGLDTAEPAQSPRNIFGKKGLAYDLIYNDTPFLQAAQKSGWDAINGREMFICQAAEQFKIWTGQALPLKSVIALDKFLNLAKNNASD